MNDQECNCPQCGGKYFTCCIAGYYKPGDRSKKIIRLTAAIMDMSTNDLVDHLEFTKPKDVNDFKTVHKMLNLAKEYGAMVSFSDAPVPLKKCECGCGEYSVELLYNGDLENETTDERLSSESQRSESQQISRELN